MPAAKNPQTGPNPKKAPKRNRSKPTDSAFDKTRAKIQATQIVNRLNKHILGTLKLESTQIQAARILLDKSLPNLQATTHSTDPHSPFTVMMAEIFTDKDK